MSFDKPTRNLLAKTVAACRERLAADITDQLQTSFGLYPDGTQLDVARTEAERRAAEDLRALLAHYESNLPQGKDRPQLAYQRLVRDAGFTLLNRLAALRLCEERGLVIECVRQGMESDGFRLFDMLANGALGNRYQTYRAFLERMFDELARDLGALFDRSNPLSHVFPSEAALTEVLALLNDAELARRELWTQDETIGWMYQYYNDPAERKKMREESQAPRNSRELAVRNQFFTPRYVVEFLTDNTLGRLWMEMRGGESVLRDECRYLVDGRPSGGEKGSGNSDPAEGSPERAAGSASESKSKSNLTPRPSPERRGERPQKDPRDLKILDPACGSGHFLLYAFNLLVLIYEEAWGDADLPPFSESGTWLARDYPSLDELRRALPELILRHNLYGVDIDPRAAQIASLALWLRAQRAWQAWGVPAGERPQVRKTNVVVAEPMPGDARLLEEFLAELEALPFIKQLVRVIFEKMKLAGEAGSLLKIEADLREAIAAAKEQWLKRPQTEQMSLWAEPARPQAQQLGMFDLSGIPDEQFWQEAEGRALEALREYARRAENGKGTRRKLFVGEAEMGFAFVDLSKWQFDVVLMNPPFGSPAKNTKDYINQQYQLSKNDIYACFVEYGLSKLTTLGYLGAITSRTGFFLGSFTNWREKVLLQKGSLISMVDLGANILDDAVVEVSAYILSKSINHLPALFLRLLVEENKQLALSESIKSLLSRNRFVISPKSFSTINTSPFVYWLDENLRAKFAEYEKFEPNTGDVRCGLSTGDNPRFVRTIWEINPSDTGFHYYPSNGELFCSFSDPIVLSYLSRREKGENRWIPLVMAGSAQPWFSPFTVIVDWKDDGKYIESFEGSTIRSRIYYFRPGFSWTRRAIRMIPYVVPTNTIPTASRYMAYPKGGLEYFSLGITASNVASGYMRMFGEKFEWPNFLVDNLKTMPIPSTAQESLNNAFTQLISSEVANRRKAYQGYEPFQEFSVPFGLQNLNVSEIIAFDYETLLGNQLEKDVANIYGLSSVELDEMQRDIFEAVTSVRQGNNSENTQDDDDSAESIVLDESSYSKIETNCSYFVGCSFVRWDIRVATNQALLPKLSNDPFAPLPTCPPGTLFGIDGLPATPDNIVSEAWLRARPDAITLPEIRQRGAETVVVLDGKEYPATIPDSEYPLPILWDGILVDDPGLDGRSPHPADLVERVRQVLRLLWPENHSAIEAEACEILGVHDLRDYFRKPGGFFADHLKRYSKSRRQAPIYWPLSTASGTYTLWLYYPRLSAETLPTALNRFVDPKIAEVEKYVAALERQLTEISGRAATDLRDKLDAQKSLLSELRDFRAELMRISALPYQPDLNDGVILNAAPFHRLFRLGKWSKDTESAWKKLQGEEYEWSHIAYVIWPERVREVCKTDKSIAIAHGLESVYVEVEGKKVKGKRKKSAAEDVDDVE